MGSYLGQQDVFWEVILATTPGFPTIQTGSTKSSTATELSLFPHPSGLRTGSTILDPSFPSSLSNKMGIESLAIRNFLFLLFSWIPFSFLSPSLNGHQRMWAGWHSPKWANFSPLPSSPPTSYSPAVVSSDFFGAVLLQPLPSRGHMGFRNMMVRLWHL